MGRKKHARGEVIIVRYADDFVMGFQHRHEAKRFLADVKDRFAVYGLQLNSEKTRLIEYAEKNRTARGAGKPETFDFLGFTHMCGRRRDHRFTIRRKTIAKRLRAKFKEVRKELMRMRHDPVPVQGKWLRSVVQGHFNYFGVPGNNAIDSFRTEIMRAWFFALRRRSHKARRLTWDRIKKLVATWLPTAKVQHPYPDQRLRVHYPR